MSEHNTSSANPAGPGTTEAAEATPRPAPRRKKILFRTAVTILSLFLALVLTDALIAARAEHRISESLYEGSNLANPPKVMLGGYPYVAAAFTHELQSVTVTANDVDVPGYGLMSVQASAQYVTVSAGDVLGGTITDAPTRKMFTRLQLDGVLLGKRMKIHELLIQNKDDISPRGGWETESVFEGTPDGFYHPATVEMRLRITAGDVKLSPVRVLRGPADDSPDASVIPGEEMDPAVRQRIMDTFTLTIHNQHLPMRGTPMRVYVSGGSVYVESEQYYTKVSLSDLRPNARPLRDEEQPGL